MSRLLRTSIQNCTEGDPTDAIRAADIFIGCEIDHHRVRDGLPGWRHFFPARDPHQCISWNPAAFHVDFRGYVRYHRSGTAEHWPIATPARGLIFVRGWHVDQPSVPVTAWGTWLLNSWWPAGRPDKHTAERRRIVDDLELPVLRQFLNHEHRDGRVTLGGGDMNSLKWHGELPGCEQIKDRGLDRAYLTADDPRIRLRGNVTEGPTTGVGPQKRHKSTLFTVALKEGKP